MATNNQIIFGRHPVVDAIRSGQRFEKLYLQRGTHGEFEKEIRGLAKEFDIPLQYVPKERMSRLTKGNHQGIVGLLSLIPYYKLEDVIPGIYEKGEAPLILVLDGVTDVRNFGAIARSAEVCGAHALVVPRSGGAPVNADALKTSAGALTRLPVCRENSLVNAVEFLQQSGINVFASDLQARKAIYDLDLTVPMAYVIGAEDAGVSPALLSRVNECFIIPQKGETDSLNVSVASGIMLYEALRQRSKK
jgi:23S rRNA (guanosine2251-2'-O)-methyltransferase